MTNEYALFLSFAVQHRLQLTNQDRFGVLFQLHNFSQLKHRLVNHEYRHIANAGRCTQVSKNQLSIIMNKNIRMTAWETKRQLSMAKKEQEYF